MLPCSIMHSQTRLLFSNTTKYKVVNFSVEFLELAMSVLCKQGDGSIAPLVFNSGRNCLFVRSLSWSVDLEQPILNAILHHW